MGRLGNISVPPQGKMLTLWLAWCHGVNAWWSSPSIPSGFCPSMPRTQPKAERWPRPGYTTSPRSSYHQSTAGLCLSHEPYFRLGQGKERFCTQPWHSTESLKNELNQTRQWWFFVFFHFFKRKQKTSRGIVLASYFKC